jgi:hypothetical protein
MTEQSQWCGGWSGNNIAITKAALGISDMPARKASFLGPFRSTQRPALACCFFATRALTLLRCMSPDLAHSDVASDHRDRITLIADIVVNGLHSPPMRHP